MEKHADETQDRLRQRAYELWEQQGSREGQQGQNPNQKPGQQTQNPGQQDPGKGGQQNQR